MKGNMLTIARKELAKFFSNRVSALVSIVLPGLLIFVLWSFMGSAMQDMFSPDEDVSPVVGVVNAPASVRALAQDSGIQTVPEEALPDADAMRERIDAGEVQAFAAFPEDFDAAVAAYDPASGKPAPQVEIYANSADADSAAAASALEAALAAYESSLSNRFDVNAGEGPYDVAESVAGEKERGTMATLLATPIRRRDIALGKLLAITLIGLLIAASSMVGIFAGLPNMMGGGVNLNVYGPVEYLLLALVVVSTTLVMVMLITVVSTLASSVKEAGMYLTPLMIVVMLVGILGMFGGVQEDLGYYLIPVYNSVQAMNGIFSFDFQAVNIAACVASNLVVTGVGVLVLQRMFDSERLMFSR